MTNSWNTKKLVAGNFLAAFGGGGLLAKGLSRLSGVPGFNADSVLAFLIGSAISLVVILGFRKWISKAGAWVSLAGAILAAMLAFYFVDILSSDLVSAWSVFALLCFTFSCIFVPRTFRSDLAAQSSSQLPWVELAYGSGYLVSLLFWRQFPDASLKISLMVCSASLALCAIFDFSVSRTSGDERPTSPQSSKETKSDVALGTDRIASLGFGILTISVLTIAVQIGIQRLCTIFSDSMPLIAFHTGALVAPVIAILGRIHNSSLKGGISKATISVFGRTFLRLRLGHLTMIVLGGMILSLWGSQELGASSPIILGALILFSLLYELAALLVFEGISNLAVTRGGVAIAFGVMGVTATIAYALFLSFNIGISGLILLVGAFLVFFLAADTVKLLFHK